MQDGIRRLFEMKNINGIDGAQNVATLHLHPLAAAAALVHRARGRIGKEARVKASYDELVVLYEPTDADAVQVWASC